MKYKGKSVYKVYTKYKVWYHTSDKVYTKFHHSKIPKDNEYCLCLSVVLLHSIFVNSDKEYYPQTLLEECWYAIKNKKNNN